MTTDAEVIEQIKADQAKGIQLDGIHREIQIRMWYSIDYLLARIEQLDTVVYAARECRDLIYPKDIFTGDECCSRDDDCEHDPGIRAWRRFNDALDKTAP